MKVETSRKSAAASVMDTRQEDEDEDEGWASSGRVKGGKGKGGEEVANSMVVLRGK